MESTNKRYEARLWAKDWEDGSGWVATDELESFDATSNLDWWKKAIEEKDYSNIFEYIEPGYEESENWDDVKYTMEIIEIDADDFWDDGKTIAKLSIWGSELKELRNA